MIFCLLVIIFMKCIYISYVFNYFLKILSDFFNIGFKYDIVKIYFFKLIFVFLYDIGN